MNNVELKVNVINQLKLFKQSTFKDVLCFLDEDIQNAQRAKATEVRVTTDRYGENKKLIIENNGAVLDNPQSLFSIAESGWDNSVKQSENPFGMGFFSNITASSKIEIYSGTKYILFDVDKMIATNDPQLEVQETDEYYDGFKLILNNFDYDNIYGFQIKERLERLGKYIHELDIYYDGELQEKMNLTEEGENYIFSTKIEDENMQGWIAIYSNYGFDSEISIYYKGRFVSKLEGYPYLKGDLHISDKVLNLTSPDRKDIIKDDKYKEFKNIIDLYIEQLANESFQYGEEDEIQQYSEAINRYINKKELVSKTKFSVFDDADKIKYLQDIAKVKRNKKNINTFKDYNGYLDKQKSTQSESIFDEVIIEESMKSTIPEAKGVIFHPSSTSYSDSSIEKPKINENKLKEKDGILLVNNEDIIFWMGFDEIEDFEGKFNILNHYGIKLIVARNKIEKEMLKGLSQEFKIYHISELREDVTFKSTISNTELNKKENRALMIFEMISRMFEKDHNLFAIGDVMTTKTVEVKGTNIKNEIIDEDVVIIKDTKADKVYVDRSIIDLSSIDESLDEKLTLKDVQFILMNLDNISESMEMLVNLTASAIKDKLTLTLAYMQ